MDVYYMSLICAVNAFNALYVDFAFNPNARRHRLRIEKAGRSVTYEQSVGKHSHRLSLTKECELSDETDGYSRSADFSRLRTHSGR